MGKKPTKEDLTKVVKSAGKRTLPSLAADVVFMPTPRQIQVKAKFWSRYQPGPFSSPGGITGSVAMEVTGVRSVADWWGKAGFKEWFLNRDEAREKLEYLFHKALNTAEQILDDPLAQANAKVQMIKVVAELANKFPTKNLERFADDDINKMDEQQIMHFLEQRGVVIRKETVVDVNSDSESEADADKDSTES